ncbi:Calx-beta domain-containing protein [Aquimarina sp. AU119]|uniref:lectin-like domain-containing protein n=1 Tax=Aquimarina sp. AU119 TaxID=2108528 RepID=UPI000D69D45C|nr:Calx-beta domain-containing protein [Aquimarina sp. AU119]
MKFIFNKSYLIKLVLLVILPISTSFGQDTYADNFNGGANYANSSGNQLWTTSWVEFDNNSAFNGRIRVNSNQLRFRNMDNANISRAIDLSTYSTVVLTLDYNRTFGNETISVQLWNGTGWNTVATTGAGTGSITYSLDPSEISGASSIRFITGSGTWNNTNETVFIDNVQFETGVLNITDGITTTTCNTIFRDTGGDLNQYQNNENLTHTICPDVPGSMLIADFTAFDVEVPSFGFIWDFLQIYDGSDTSGTLIGTFYNTNPPGTITATNPSGCLTFVFSSDNSFTEDGWEATISCSATTPQLAISDITVNENAGTADLTVSHSGGNAAGAFTVAYSTANNSANTPADYTTTSSTIAFSGTSPENQTLTVPIPIVDDNFAEATESFFVNLGTIVGDPSITISDGQGEITINDDDNASIAINDVTVNEGDGTATFTITLSGANVAGGFSVPYTLVNGSATNPADYTTVGATPSPINFTGNINETQQITIPIVDDTDIEGNHNFFVNLGTVSSSLVATSDNQGEATIEDNDASIIINDLTRSESAGTIDFTVTHNGADTSGSFTVTFTTADNTATAPGDYITTSSPPVLTFSGTSGETQTISVPLVFNMATEPTETFFVNLTGVSNPAVIITDSQGIGTILDVDTSTDIDGDGIPNNNDIDNDNDGIPDCFEDGAENTVISDIFSINGDAVQIGPLEAQLTQDLNNQAGSATITDRIDFNDSFSFSFEAFLGSNNNSGADGIAIIFHDDPAGAAAVGGTGEGMGAQGIQNGIVLELDTWNNGPTPRGDIGADHGMIWDSDNQQGSGLLTTAISLGNLEDGNWHDITITWDSTTNTITYTVDGTTAGTLTNDIINNYFGGNNLVFFGFTASTGGAANDQRIRFRDLCEIPLFVDQDGDGIPNYLDLDSDNDGIFDVVEGGDGAFDTNNDGVINSSDTGYTDTNNDGQADASVDIIENPDTNTNNLPDFIDNDSDGDGCFDALEAAGSFTTADIDGDGELTGGVQTNGVPNVVSPNGQATTTEVITVATTNINTQPLAQSVITGGTANYSVAATGNGTLFYQWQQSTNSGISWTNLIDGGSSPAISGATTNTLTLTTIPINYDTYQYRVIINNENSSCIDVISNEVLLDVRNGTVITNRRITYRVNRGRRGTSSVPTGTLTTDLSINNFDDGQNSAFSPYQLQVQNTTATPFNYEIYIQNVPYASIPGLNLGNHTLITTDNGDGTFNYLFTSTMALGAFQNTIISGSGAAPSPQGTGPACGCVSFYKL